MRYPRIGLVAACSLVLVLATTLPAAAYIGPGAGLSVIGTILALVATLGLAIFGFVWFPLKRVLRQRRAATQRQAQSNDALRR
jgi:membrane-bound ClpP family serine protease